MSPCPCPFTRFSPVSPAYIAGGLIIIWFLLPVGGAGAPEEKLSEARRESSRKQLTGFFTLGHLVFKTRYRRSGAARYGKKDGLPWKTKTGAVEKVARGIMVYDLVYASHATWFTKKFTTLTRKFATVRNEAGGGAHPAEKKNGAAIKKRPPASIKKSLPTQKPFAIDKNPQIYAPPPTLAPAAR